MQYEFIVRIGIKGPKADPDEVFSALEDEQLVNLDGETFYRTDDNDKEVSYEVVSVTRVVSLTSA
jgi:hypothetical protein